MKKHDAAAVLVEDYLHCCFKQSNLPMQGNKSD